MCTDLTQPTPQPLPYSCILRDIAKVVRSNRLVRSSPGHPWLGAHDTTRPVVGFTYKVHTRTRCKMRTFWALRLSKTMLDLKDGSAGRKPDQAFVGVTCRKRLRRKVRLDDSLALVEWMKMCFQIAKCAEWGVSSALGTCDPKRRAENKQSFSETSRCTPKVIP